MPGHSVFGHVTLCSVLGSVKEVSVSWLLLFNPIVRKEAGKCQRLMHTSLKPGLRREVCSLLCVKRLSFVPEEKFAQAVCFLLVDLYLLTFQPEKALHLLAVLDKLSAQGSSRNGKGEVSRHQHGDEEQLHLPKQILFNFDLLNMKRSFFGFMF